MRAHFWGVRGSLPTPLTPMKIQNKITAIVQRITPQDLVSEDARENFIQQLPSWLNSTVGGNSACVELETDDKQTFLLDAGSGLREFSRCLGNSEKKEFHIFFSHFHWDHIQGLPFFSPFFDKNTIIHFYSPWPNTIKLLSRQMMYPYFPVKWGDCSKNITFHLMKPGKAIKVGGVTVNCIKMAHPGCSYSYSFVQNGKKVIYATDVELTGSDARNSSKIDDFFSNADILIFDSQYTVEELYSKPNWGHSSYCSCVEAAANWNVKRLYLFHHEPTYDDKKLNNLLETARWYADSIGGKNLIVELATESTDIEL